MGGLAPGKLKSRRGRHSSPRRLHQVSAGIQELTAGKTLSTLRGWRHFHRHQLVAAWPILVRRNGPFFRRHRHGASLAGADGVVGSSHRLSEVERTTPAAPSKEWDHLLDGAAPPTLPRSIQSRCGRLHNSKELSYGPIPSLRCSTRIVDGNGKRRSLSPWC